MGRSRLSALVLVLVASACVPGPSCGTHIDPVPPPEPVPLDAGGIRDAGPVSFPPSDAAVCMPDPYELNDSFAAGQVADLPDIAGENGHATLAAEIGTASDVDWYRLAVHDATPTALDLAFDLDLRASADDVDLSVWYECEYGAVELNCLAGDDAVPLPTMVDAGTITGTSPGCISALPSGETQHVRMSVTCPTDPTAMPPLPITPGQAFIRVRPSRFAACEPYDISIHSCLMGAEEPAETPADAVMETAPALPAFFALAHGSYDRQGDTDWFRVHLTGLSPTPLTVSLGSSAVAVATLEIVYACDSGTGGLTCDAGNTSVTRDVGDGAAPWPACDVSLTTARATADCGGDANGTLYVGVLDANAPPCTTYELSLNVGSAT